MSNYYAKNITYYSGNVWSGQMLKPSLHYPVSSVDKTKSALCRMSKMVVKVRLSTWDAPANSWTNEFATTWNYAGDPKATVEDLKQTVAGQMVLGKVMSLLGSIK